MEPLHVRSFREDDTGFAYEMIAAERWNDRKEDIRRMFDYEPNGCFVAEVDGESVGHVFSVSYGKLGWIGFLIVKAKCRGTGVGTSLMKKAMGYLTGHGVETVKLEAVPKAASLYRRLGFIDEYDSLRFAGTRRVVSSSGVEHVLPMEANRIDEVARFDEKYFGANRWKVISRLFQEYPEHCLIFTSGSAIEGYIMCRRADAGYKLGPWICNPEYPKIAKELLAKCLSSIKPREKIHVGVPAPNETAIAILNESGFEQHSKSIRMRL